MDSALFGREAPLSALLGALDRTIAGRGGLALVSGEAGIGKSAIVDALSRAAQARGADVVWGRAWEFAEAPPYFPVTPQLRALDVPLGGDAFQLWEAVLTALAERCREQAHVWILEDLHAADLGTLDLLAFLAQPLNATRALVVATLRDRDPRISERMAQRLARMSRDGLDLRLSPLDASAVATLAEHILGRALPADARRRLLELTGGNPLFIVECLRAFKASAGLADGVVRHTVSRLLGADGAPLTLPGGLGQVVLDRVAHLPASTREALSFASVLGRDFTAATVARMQDTLPARVIDALLPALRGGLISEQRPGGFVFSHVLVRDAIEHALPAERRAALHHAAAAALAPLGDGADVLVERARHALSALPHAAGAEALDLASRALAWLEREGAFDRALELHQRLDHARRDGFAPPATHEDELAFAHVARQAGRSDLARAATERVIAQARRAAAPEHLARAVLLQLADVQPGVMDPRQVLLIEEALDALGERAPALRCRLQARLATALQPTLDQTRPLALMRAAIALAEATGDVGARIDVLDQAPWALYYAPRAERAGPSSTLYRLASDTGDLAHALSAVIALAFLAIEGGDFDAFAERVAEAQVLADALGHPRHRWRPILLASMRATLHGDVATSERLLFELAELAPLIDDPAFPVAFATHRIYRGRLLCRDDEVLAALAAHAQATAHLVDAQGQHAFIRALVHARRLDAPATAEALAALGSAEQLFGLEPTFFGMIAEAYAVAAGDEACRRLRAELVARGIGEVYGDPVCFSYEGPAARVLGLLDERLGELERADQRLSDAYARAERHGQLPWLAQIGYELARVRLARARPDEARVLVDDARTIAQRLAMSSLLARLERLLHAHPGPAPSTALDHSDPIASAPLTLTRQGELWRVSRGGHAVTIKDSRGMQILARLVEHPEVELHVLALIGDEVRSAPDTSAGAHLDQRAIAAYRRRLAELDEDLTQAEEAADLGRTDHLRGEREALVAELSRALGLGGRQRQSGSASERARINVQRRLKDAIARIGESDKVLGRYLEGAVRTGTYCSFRS